VQRGDEGYPEQVLALAAFQVAQEQPQQHKTPEDNKNFIAGIAAVKQDIGRNHEQKGADQRADPAKIAPPGKNCE